MSSGYSEQVSARQVSHGNETADARHDSPSEAHVHDEPVCEFLWGQDATAASAGDPPD